MQTTQSTQKPSEVRSDHSLALPVVSGGLTIIVIAILLSGLGRSRPR